LKVWEKNTGKTVENTGIGNDFVNKTQIAQKIIVKLISRIISNLKTAQQMKQLPDKGGSL
jgi:hypothetical protein